MYPSRVKATPDSSPTNQLVRVGRFSDFTNTGASSGAVPGLSRGFGDANWKLAARFVVKATKNNLDEYKQVLKSHGTGVAFVKCTGEDGDVREVKLMEVLYIPALDSGLISVRKLTKKGFQVNFDGSAACSVVSAAGKTVVLGELNGSLFVLKTLEYASGVKSCRLAKLPVYVAPKIRKSSGGRSSTAIVDLPATCILPVT